MRVPITVWLIFPLIFCVLIGSCILGCIIECCKVNFVRIQALIYYWINIPNYRIYPNTNNPTNIFRSQERIYMEPERNTEYYAIVINPDGSVFLASKLNGIAL